MKLFMSGWSSPMSELMPLLDFWLYDLRDGAEGDSKEIVFVSLSSPAMRKKTMSPVRRPADAPDLFDMGDTLKPGSCCQSGEEDRANPDIEPVNGPQHKPPLFLPVLCLRTFLESQVRFVVGVLFNSSETSLCRIVLFSAKCGEPVDRVYVCSVTLGIFELRTGPVLKLVIISRLDCGAQPAGPFGSRGINACRLIRQQIFLILRWTRALGFHK